MSRITSQSDTTATGIPTLRNPLPEIIVSDLDITRRPQNGRPVRFRETARFGFELLVLLGITEIPIPRARPVS